MNFAEISKSLRKEKGLSQAELATALNLGRSCVSMLEIGKNEPTAGNLLLYADFFECSIDFLLGREDDMGIISVIKTTPENPLADDESELLRFYRSLDEDFQRRVLDYIRKLSAVEGDERLIKPRKA